MFFTERVAQEKIIYNFPIPGDGIFTLITKHSENMIKKANERIFNIFVGGELAHSNVDIYKEMGFKSGFNTYTQIKVKGNNLEVEGIEVIGGVIGSGSKVIQFFF